MQSYTKKYSFMAGISILIIIAFFIVVDINSTLKNINVQFDRDAQNGAIYIEELITNIKSSLASISKTPLIKTHDSEKVTDYLAELTNLTQASALVLADKNGMRWAGTKKVDKPYSIADTEVFKGVYNSGSIYVTGAGKARFDNDIEFIVGYPIFNKKHQLENVLYAPVSASKYKKILSEIKLESSGNLHIIDNKGFLLLSTQEDVQKLQKYQTSAENDATLISLLKLNNKIIGKDQIEGTDWTIIVDQNASAVAKSIAKKVLFDLLVFLLILLPVTIVFYIILTQIDKQKQQLIKTNKKLQSLATTDGLTGLFNHRSFQEKLSDKLEEAGSYNPLTLLMMDIDNFKIFNDTYGHQTGDRVLKHLSSILLEFFKDKGIVARYGGEEFAVILPNIDYDKGLSIGTTLSKLIKDTRFIIDEGVETHITVSIGFASYPKNASDRENLIRFADQALYRAKEDVSNKVQMYYSALEELRGNIDDHDVLKIVYTLNTIINARDKYTFAHSERVMNYAVRIAQRMKLPQEEISNITIGALLHDIGKIEVSGEILNKPGRLSNEEFEHIKQHPVVGADIIKPMKSLEKAMPFVLYHHERYDGKGYPYGLKGKSIPLYGRIAAVADSFDAMTTKRPYQSAKSIQDAINELKNNAGTQFDPEIVDLFMHMLLEKDIPNSILMN